MGDEPPPPKPLLRWIPAIVFVALPSLIFLTRLGPGRFLYGDDVTQTFYYTSGLIGKALASGRLPVWDSHTMCGMPLLAALQYGVLYPLSWIPALFGPGAAWTLSVTLHLALAGFFAQAWLQRGLGLGRWPALAGSLLFMLSGFAVSHVFGGHLSLICTYPWAAALLWRMERFFAGPTAKRAALLALVTVLLILAGHPQTALIAAIAVGARLVHHVLSEREGRKERLLATLGAVGAMSVGVLLAMPQLLPTLELTGRTQRAAPSYEFSATYSFPPESALTLLAPLFFGDSQHHPYWGRWLQTELVGFAGVAGLALAVLGAVGRRRQRLLWTGLAVAGLVLALGRHTPLFKAYYHVVPWAALFRIPSRHLFLFTLALVPLVAMGLERLLQGDDRLRRHATLLGCVTAGVLVLVLAGWISLRFDGAWERVLDRETGWSAGEREARDFAHPEFRKRSRAMASGSLMAAAATLLAVAAALLSIRRIPPARGGVALAALLAAELVVFARWYSVGHSETDMQWPPGFIDAARAGPSRIASFGDDRVEATGMCRIAGLDHVGGYEPMLLRRYLELMRAAGGVPESRHSVAVLPTRPGPVLDLLGARIWLLPDARPLPPGWRSLGRMGTWTVAENPAALPRAFLAGRSVVLSGEADRLRAMASPSFDPAGVVILESGAESAGTGIAPGTVVVKSHKPGSYDLEAVCATEAWLVLTETDYPGWTAEVDGVRTEIRRADHFLQAVRLPPGRHAVRFRFRSGSFRTGLIVAAATLAAFAAGTVLVRRARRA